MPRLSIVRHPLFKTDRQRLALIVGLLLIIYLVLPQLSIFKGGLDALANADLKIAGLAVVGVILTYAVAALTYWLLALKPLNYVKTLFVEMAGAFVNRLLPAGLGAMGLNYIYLRGAKHSGSQAAAVVAINNGLGLVGHLILLATFSLGGQAYGQFHWRPALTYGEWILILVLLMISVFLVSRLAKTVLRNLKGQSLIALSAYRYKAKQLFMALLSSLLLTGLHVLVLMLSAQALGQNLSWSGGLIVLTAGVALGTVTPLPGGLGGVEAGLVGALIASGATSQLALAVSLLYRLLTFWLPLIGGSLIFVLINRRHWFSQSFTISTKARKT